MQVPGRYTRAAEAVVIGSVRNWEHQLRTPHDTRRSGDDGGDGGEGEDRDIRCGRVIYEMVVGSMAAEDTIIRAGGGR